MELLILKMKHKPLPITNKLLNNMVNQIITTLN